MSFIATLPVATSITGQSLMGHDMKFLCTQESDTLTHFSPHCSQVLVIPGTIRELMMPQRTTLSLKMSGSSFHHRLNKI